MRGDADEIHVWQRYIRGFRRDHNFAFTSGISQSEWDVASLGTIEGRKYNANGFFSRFQYTFHLPLYRGFGTMLGSAMGYHYQNTSETTPFRVVSSLQYPGLVAGLVLNFSPAFRLSGALEYGLERYNGIADRDGVGEDPEISITAEAGEVAGFFDIFYSLTWALRMEGRYRISNVVRPNRASGFPVDTSIRKTETWTGVGILFHFL